MRENQNWQKKLDTWLEENLSDSNLRIEDLARAVALGERQFYRQFKQKMEITPNEYIKEKRLQKALEILENRALPTVKRVSLTVGYKKPEYFSSLFEKRFGRRPISYLKP